jgi:hypothetical protein
MTVTRGTRHLAFYRAVLVGHPKETPLFQASNGQTRTVTGKAMISKRICELAKRRVQAAGFNERGRGRYITQRIVSEVPSAEPCHDQKPSRHFGYNQLN